MRKPVAMFVGIFALLFLGASMFFAACGGAIAQIAHWIADDAA